MMLANGATNSVEIFKQRVHDGGLDAFWDKFVEKRWTTYSQFAFSTSYQPGMQDDLMLRKQVFIPLLGSEEHALVDEVRRQAKYLSMFFFRMCKTLMPPKGSTILCSRPR